MTQYKHKWCYRSLQTLYYFSFLTKFHVGYAHTRHTNRKIEFLPKFMFFKNPHPIFVGPKMCLMCAHHIQFFFSRDYMHILKNFYHYYFLTCKTLSCIHYCRGDTFFFKKRLFWANYRNPPNETKSSKILIMLGTYHIDSIKYF